MTCGFGGRFQKRSLRVAGYRVAARVICPSDSTSVRSQVRQPGLEMVMVCKPCATSISEGVRPTEFPSTETCAPEGCEVICNRVMAGGREAVLNCAGSSGIEVTT